MPPTTRSRFDFSRPATLAQSIEGLANVFDGSRQLGRAYAILGAGDGEIRVAAPDLGDSANGAIFTVGDPVVGGRVTLAGRAPSVTGPKQLVQLWPSGSEDTQHAVDRLNAFNFDPHGQLSRDQQAAQVEAQREGRPVWRISADHGAGTGGDPPPTGSVEFAGGGGRSEANAFYAASDDVNGGLFAFDAVETLVLRQVVLLLESSVAWTVSLARIDPGYRAEVVATIASGTGTSALVIDKPVYIAPSFAIVVTAPMRGNALVTVQRA